MNWMSYVGSNPTPKHLFIILHSGESRKNMQKFWYFFTTFCCPLCCGEKTYKERMIGEKPKEWSDRHEFLESWDGCQM